ncbi:zinc finger domain-containing protein [Mycobacterium sp. 4D054]|uniref:zinc finger domain-containing protein n=1 Tax=Mycobacterium sp. 4D054 TaxID=3457440 RepID=UPI003FCFFFAA
MNTTHRRASLDDTTPDAVPTALSVDCPLCGADAGQPCQDAVRGWVRNVGPHLTRVAAAVDPKHARGGAQ